MKRIILSLILFTFFSCSSDDSEVSSEEFSITLKDQCNDNDETVYTQYCVSEETYTEVQEVTEINEERHPDIECVTYTFSDINGETVSGHFSELHRAENACEF